MNWSWNRMASVLRAGACASLVCVSTVRAGDVPAFDWTNLTEAQFKALHELRTDQLPAPLGETVRIGETDAYLSLPKDAKAPLPAVVVIHEWWGLNDHVRHFTDRLAGQGYAALAVDLYRGKVTTNSDSAYAAMKEVDPARSKATLQAALAFLKTDSRVKATRLGSIGWCFGGGWSLQTAILAPELSACVIYYGRLESDPAVLAPIQAEILGVFGTQDQAISMESVGAFEKALTTAKKKHTIRKYDAVHAFANPSNPKYDQKSAEDAWKHALELFARTLKK